jgi:hypothetical protein
MRTAIQGPWSAPVGSTQEMGFSTSWFEDEAEFEEEAKNKSMVSGLALSLAFSASVWAGIAFVVTSILR